MIWHDFYFLIDFFKTIFFMKFLWGKSSYFGKIQDMYFGKSQATLGKVKLIFFLPYKVGTYL